MNEKDTQKQQETEQSDYYYLSVSKIMSFIRSNAMMMFEKSFL